MTGTNEEEYLSNVMRACVNVCTAQGYCFPVLMVMTGSKGTLLATRFLEHEDGQIRSQMLAQDADEPTPGWPVNVIVVDAYGKTLRLRMGSSYVPPDSILN